MRKHVFENDKCLILKVANITYNMLIKALPFSLENN